MHRTNYNPDHFWSLTDAGPREDPVRCWIWQGPVNGVGNGYPRYKGQSATRIALYLSGISVTNMRQQAHHICHEIMCVNPFHLQLIDRRDHARVTRREVAERRMSEAVDSTDA